MGIEDASRLSGIDGLIDYGSARGRALLIASGSGIMMSVMDAESSFRWCVDSDVCGGNIVDFAILAARHVSYIGLAGWFSITDPAAFREIMSCELKCPTIAYGGNVLLGVATLREFLDECRELAVNAPQPELAEDWELYWLRVP